MKFKSILLTAAATLSLTAATMAQVPNYVPTNGLVGWWPFNGNANDESGNGNNGSVNGATLTADRFGNSNKAYFFNGSSNSISIPNIAIQGNGNRSISAWFYTYPSALWSTGATIISTGSGTNQTGGTFNLRLDNQNQYAGFMGGDFSGGGNDYFPNGNILVNNSIWHHIVVTYSNGQLEFYIDGNLEKTASINILNTNGQTNFVGKSNDFNTSAAAWWDGKIDDIGIWNRVLTQTEITALYNAVNCANNATVTPQINSLTTGSTAIFVASSSDPNPSYIWQSDFGQGFQTLNDYGNYLGVNTNSLSISNVQLSEHNQPIRVISTSGNCIDTSNVAVINILDTCISNVTVYDTLLTTVTDTLVINALITGINPPNNLNTLKVFPNPASTHITIDYGNFNAMSGYTLTIVNSIGQTVFTTPINQQTSYIDLSTWTGNGIYFVQLIDPQNNTIENRKIVIQ